MDHHRGSADDGEINFADGVRNFVTSVVFVVHAEHGDEEADDNAKKGCEEGNEERVSEALDDKFPTGILDEILVKVNQLVQKERELGRVGKSFGEIFKEKVIYGGAAQLAGMVGFYDVINIGREAFETIRELDTALVDLKKTTVMNSSQLEEFYFDSNDVAKQMGVTTQAIIEQASAWSRLNKIGLLYGDI